MNDFQEILERFSRAPEMFTGSKDLSALDAFLYGLWVGRTGDDAVLTIHKAWSMCMGSHTNIPFHRVLEGDGCTVREAALILSNVYAQAFCLWDRS